MIKKLIRQLYCELWIDWFGYGTDGAFCAAYCSATYGEEYTSEKLFTHGGSSYPWIDGLRFGDSTLGYFACGFTLCVDPVDGIFCEPLFERGRTVRATGDGAKLPRALDQFELWSGLDHVFWFDCMDQNGGWKFSRGRSRAAFGICRITAVLPFVLRVYCCVGVCDSLATVWAKVAVSKLVRAVNTP